MRNTILTMIIAAALFVGAMIYTGNISISCVDFFYKFCSVVIR